MLGTHDLLHGVVDRMPRIDQGAFRGPLRVLVSSGIKAGPRSSGEERRTFARPVIGGNHLYFGSIILHYVRKIADSLGVTELTSARGLLTSSVAVGCSEVRNLRTELTSVFALTR